MPKCKDIISYNEKNQRHGYWESYWSNDNLHFKGHYDNGEQIGYWETYYRNGQLCEKYYYAKM